MKVLPIKSSDAYPWLLEKHYAKRIPSISYAFGLFDGDLIGVCCFGTPSSSPLRDGIAGSKNSGLVLELNRLVLNDDSPVNSASYLVSNAIKLIPKPRLIVSYADTSVGHIGTIYQATNFGYYGLSEKRTDWKVRGLEHLHGQTIADEFRGKPNRAGLMRSKYGDDFYLQDRPRKHRYIYVHGSKLTKRSLTKEILYEKTEYPRGKSSRYDSGGKVQTQALLF